MKKNILIVEDEPALRTALDDTLSAHGFDVALAKNGEECLSYITSTSPDLILLDISMPKVDGLTVIKKLRENKQLGDTKVIVLTNHADISTLSEVMMNNVFHYIIKSDTSLAQVLEQVNESLDHTMVVT